MKKILLFAFCLFAIASYGQKKIVWFDFGLKAQGGATGLLNSDISDSDAVNYELNLTNGFGLGAKLGMNFDYGGLALEGMYFNGTQTWETAAGQDKFAPEMKFTTVDVYALYKSNKNLGYFEIGPKASFLTKMTSDGADVTSDYNSPNFAGVLGFGANLIGSDGAFTGMLGLRFEYGFTDIVSDGGRANQAPITTIPDVSTSASTNPFFAGLVFELNWGIGYFGVAQCGQRSKFIMF